MQILTVEDQRKLFSAVQVASDASKFEPHPSNRESNQKHIDNLTNMFNTETRFVTPLLVVQDNGKLYVVDGRHRLAAMQKLNKPFLYIDVTKAISIDGPPSPEDIAAFVHRFNTGVLPSSRPDMLKHSKANPLVRFFEQEAKNTPIKLYNGTAKKYHPDDSTVASVGYPAIAFVEEGLGIKEYKNSKYSYKEELSEADKKRIRMMLKMVAAIADAFDGSKTSDNAGFRNAVGKFVKDNFTDVDNFPYDKLTAFLRKKTKGITHANREKYYSAFKNEFWLKEFKN